MKKLAALLGFASAVVPAAAFACPTMQSCCGSQLGQYASTFGIGLLFGVGSVAVEAALRKRKK